MTIDNYTFIKSNSELISPAEANIANILISRSGEVAFCLGTSGHFIYVNDATCRMSEYSRQELLSMTVMEIDIDLDEQVWSELWQASQSNPQTIQSRYQTKSGQIFKVEVTISYVKHQEQEFWCVFAREKNDEVVLPVQQHLDKSNDFDQDIQSELKKSLFSLDSIIESTSIGILAVNLEGEIVYYNQKFIDMWQVPTTVNISNKYSRIKAFFETQVKDLERVGSYVWELSSHKDSERYDLVELKDGRTFAHYSQPYRLNEKIIGRVWSIQDITESKRLEEILKLKEARFRTLAETTEASILLIQGKELCYVNPAVEVLTGYTIKELLTNFDLNKLIVNKRLRQVNRQDGAPLCEYQELEIRCKNNTHRWLACTVALLDGMFDFAGKPVELVTAIDITDYKQAEFKLCQALEQAKRRSEQKERFVSMLCHQFRTPLNIASFSTDLLKRYLGQWTEEKKYSYLALIQLGIKQISELLDEILLFGKAEGAKLHYKPTEIDLNQFCLDIAQQVELANSNQRSINFIHGDNCTTAYFDPKMLQHILTNLLSNAIKYSPNNSIVTFELRCEDGNMIFNIIDAGIGIPIKDRQQIFDPFYRGSNIDSIPGTGLGLAIVKTIVDLHGGVITLESQVGVGTTFTVMLPLGVHLIHSSICKPPD
jgi:PAS domain S-box-containing protein